MKSKRIVYWFLSFVVGLVFLYSAYSKLFPIELFEIKLVETGVANWYIAPVFARVIVGIEFFIGIVLLLNLYVHRVFYLLVIGLLVLFSLHLGVQIVLFGNEGNCGCFSNEIPMTPAQAILKNIVTIALLFVLYKKYNGFKFTKLRFLVPAIFVIAIIVSFIINPVLVIGKNPVVSVNEKLPLELLDQGNQTPSVALKKGKWVIAYLSLTCRHCQTAAYKLQVIKRQNPDFPIYFVINGEDKNLKSFFEVANLNNISYSKVNGKDFIRMSGTGLPAIYFVNNQTIESKVKYVALDKKMIEDWLNAK